MKEQFTVYLEPDLMKALTEYAERRGKPKSLSPRRLLRRSCHPMQPNVKRRPWHVVSTGSPVTWNGWNATLGSLPNYRSFYSILVDGDAFSA